MRIAAHRGNRLHAPENTRQALISGYTAGADVLEFDAQLTRDGHLVVSHDPTVERLTGQPGRIPEMTRAEVRRLDAGATFRVGDKAPRYRGARIETVEELLDLLPRGVEKLFELKHDSALDAARRRQLVARAAEALTRRGLVAETVIYSKDRRVLEAVREALPEVRIAAFDWELAPAEQIKLMLDVGADGLVTSLETVLRPDGQLTDAGRELKRVYAEEGLALGAILYPFRGPGEPGVFRREEYEALRGEDFVWSLSTDSVLQVAPFLGRGWVWLEEPFRGRDVDRDLWALGYAKASGETCHVRLGEGGGVVVDIKPYDGWLPSAQPDGVAAQLQRLRLGVMDARMNWPWYAGGGVGLVPGIDGDFSAEVDYTVVNVGQATTLEMAVLNVDPGAHQPPWNEDDSPRYPASFRNKDSFYDPHGAPPYVGVEHDEDDGYRINWNLGTEYDSNQYGRPTGDGTAKAGRLRLERRGAFFSAYYRNAVDAPDWVCVGAVRNDSLNPRVFLRCVGKRWRQEREDGNGYNEIIPNTFVFRDLKITRFR